MSAAIAPHVCAVCGADIWETTSLRTAQLGIGDSYVVICTPCDTETPRELRGPERGYIGGAGPSMPRPEEMAAASRRAIGAAYDRDSAIVNEIARRPAPAANPDDVIFDDVRAESIRLNRVYRGHTEKVSARAPAARDVARRVKKRKKATRS